MNNITISIVIPLYHGKKYIKRLLQILEDLANASLTEIEVIFVNDSPTEKIDIRQYADINIHLCLINNVVNLGIHASRIKGLKNCNGEFVVFLDQDDTLLENSLNTQLQVIKNSGADIVVGNGINEVGIKKGKIYKTEGAQKLVIKQWPYLYIQNMIVSPGQCMIRKKAIPQQWFDNVLTVNGADDYFLWLLMLDKKCKIAINYNVIYIHKNTGNNTSNNEEQMSKSVNELIKNLASGSFDKKKLKILNDSLYFHLHKRWKKNTFFGEIIKIVFFRFIYKILWKKWINIS